MVNWVRQTQKMQKHRLVLFILLLDRYLRPEPKPKLSHLLPGACPLMAIRRLGDCGIVSLGVLTLDVAEKKRLQTLSNC